MGKESKPKKIKNKNYPRAVNAESAVNDQFSENQQDVSDDTSSQLMEQSKQTFKSAKQVPAKVKNTYRKAQSFPDKIKEKAAKLKENAKQLTQKIKRMAKAAYGAAKNLAKFIRHPIQGIKNGFLQLPAKMAQGLNNFKNNFNPKKILQKLSPVSRIRNRIAKRFQHTAKAVQNTIKLFQKIMRFSIKAIKLALKSTVKLIQLTIRFIQLLIQLIIATWPIWLILFIIGIIVGTIWWFLDNDSTMDNKSLNNERSEYNGSVMGKDGNAQMTSISGNTKIIEAFYQYFSEKSLWVVYDGAVYNDDKIEHDNVLGDVYTPLQYNTESFNDKFMDENGEIILKDYQNRESMFYVNPNALFVYDKYLHGEQIRFPEQIVQHVAYDYYPDHLRGEDLNNTNDKRCLTEYDASGRYNPNYNKFILKQLTDDETRNLTITSQKYKLVSVSESEVSDDFRNDPDNHSVSQIYVPDGNKKTEGVWDYGIGSILHYVKYLIKHENRGTYENFEVWDQTVYLDDMGNKHYGQSKRFANYDEYETDTNHDNYTATDIAELTGDDRIKTYTAKNAPTEAMRQQLADEDSYFIDWVVTAAGDISNSVVYEWKDSGERFSQPESFQKTVKKYDEVISIRTETKSVALPCNGSTTVVSERSYQRPLRQNINDTPTYAKDITIELTAPCDDPECSGTHSVSYTYQEEYLEEVYTDVDITFHTEVNGTTWNKEPFYDSAPFAENISGRRYYEDYLTHYHTYVPYSVTGFFDKEEMLKRIQLNVSDPNLEEELTKILERSDMTNDGNNSLNNSGGYTLGSGSNGFEQLYNGSAKETIERIWDGLISWGFTAEQAAGIMGNIYAESGFNPAVVNSNGGAIGLCQWLFERKTNLETFAATVNNADWTDLNSQIQFICMELDSNSYQWTSNAWQGCEDYQNIFLTSSDPCEIADAIMCGFERPSESERASSGPKRREAALAAYSLLASRETTYPIDVIAPSSGGGSGTQGSGNGNIFMSIWNWLKNVGDTIKKGISTLFGFEDEYYNIMDQKERYEFQYHSIQESDVDYLLQSIYAYTDNVVISDYYDKLTDEFFVERFTDIFRNPIGTSWSSSAAKGSDDAQLSIYIKLRNENYPEGFQPPLDECILSNTDSNYGLYIQATNGQNVYAVCDGTIIKTGKDSRYGGKYLILDNGYSETIYGHLKDILVTVGQDVKAGDIIATVDGDELFFGITNQYQTVVDPSFILHALINDGTLGSEIAAYACQFVGNPYVWGGTSLTHGSDCSGFTMSVFAQFGITLPHRASMQAQCGIPVPQNQLQPGDIICFKNRSGSIHHVALYIGNGEIVHAKGAKWGIVIDSMNYSSDTKICRRLIGY